MDPGFAEQLQQLQQEALLTPKEADYRQYLVKTGAAEELVKVLVGLEEAAEKPADAARFIQEHFGSQELALTKGVRPIDKINEVVAANEALKTQFADLESKFATTLAKMAEVEAGRRTESLQQLLALHPTESEAEDEEAPPAELDLVKCYAAILTKLPAGDSDGEGTEAVPWAAESAEQPPVGSASAAAISAWAAQCFDMDGSFERRFDPALLATLLTCADPTPPPEPAEGEEPPPPIEMAVALQVHAMFWALAQSVAPAAEAPAAAPAAE